MDALCSYLPASILSHLLDADTATLQKPPFRQTYQVRESDRRVEETGREERSDNGDRERTTPLTVL